MKIVAGKHKGRSVEGTKERSVRPTTSRVRESMFNLLKHGKFLYSDDFISDDNPDLIEGRKLADIFCGTGVLGLEAISRGAEHVTFIDQSPKSLELTRHNVASLGEEENSKFIRSDSTNLPRAAYPCKLVFIDPPYHKNLAIPSLKSLAEQGWLEYGAVVVLEHGKQDDIVTPEGYNLLDHRSHDKTKISIYQYIGG